MEEEIEVRGVGRFRSWRLVGMAHWVTGMKSWLNGLRFMGSVYSFRGVGISAWFGVVCCVSRRRGDGGVVAARLVIDDSGNGGSSFFPSFFALKGFITVLTFNVD